MGSKQTGTMLVLALGSALLLSACNNQGQTGQPGGLVPASGASAAAATTSASSHAKATHHKKSKSRHKHAVASARAPSVAVGAVDLGSAVSANGMVTTSTSSFSPGNTVYAEVTTTGTGHATLDAKWTFQNGQTLSQQTRSISPDGPSVTTFAFSNASGLPVGHYKVEISLNGAPAASSEFSVQ